MFLKSSSKYTEAQYLQVAITQTLTSSGLLINQDVSILQKDVDILVNFILRLVGMKAKHVREYLFK